MENNETKPTEASEKKPLTRWTINRDLCTGCGECVDACLRSLLVIEKRKVVMTNEKLCSQCGDCMMACTTRAIVLT